MGPDPTARRLGSAARTWGDSGTAEGTVRHCALTVVGVSGDMILIAFTLSLSAAAALIIGLGAVVSAEAPAASGARGDAGLI